MQESKKLKILSVVIVAALVVGLAVPARAMNDAIGGVWSKSWTVQYPSIGGSYVVFDVNTPTSNTDQVTWYYQMYDTLIRVLNREDYNQNTLLLTYYLISDLRSDIRSSTSGLPKITSLLSTVSSSISSGFSSVDSKLSSIISFIAPQYKRDLENNQQDNVEQITDDFFSGSQSATSLGTDDFSDLKSFTSGAGTMLSSPANADQFSNALSSGLSSSNGLRFFTSSVHDELTLDSVSLQGDVEDVYIDFLSPLLSDVDLLLGD